jgi:hypothetical protein
MKDEVFETISIDQLSGVAGGEGFWTDLVSAGAGAVNMFVSPFSAASRGVAETTQALSQGHTFSDSVASGLVQASGTFPNEPRLSNIPANPNANQPRRR